MPELVENEEPEAAEHTELRHHEPVKRQSKYKRRWHGPVANLTILLLAPLLAIFLTTFVFQSYQVDGVSMQNTLQNGDRLIVWKGARSWDRLFGSQYVPGRGDIVIVNQQDLSACEQTGKVIIKRVIGLPGDHVVYKDGSYTVYDSAHPGGFDPDTTLPYGAKNTALLDNPGSANIDVKLTKTELFVSGDHRANSCDSRYFGPVQTTQVLGKLVARVYPVSSAECF